MSRTRGLMNYFLIAIDFSRRVVVCVSRSPHTCTRMLFQTRGAESCVRCAYARSLSRTRRPSRDAGAPDDDTMWRALHVLTTIAVRCSRPIGRVGLSSFSAGKRRETNRQKLLATNRNVAEIFSSIFRTVRCDEITRHVH